MSNEQLRLKAAAEGVADAARGARAWVADVRGSAASVGNEADSLIEETRKAENLARKLARAAERRMCVGVYGASQQGKSYLVSVLARPQGKAQLLARFGGERLDFITEINPSGGKESTGLVTRFTIHPSGLPLDAEYPVEVRLLTETDLVKILSNAFQSDFDQNNLKIERPRDEAVRRILADCEKLRQPRVAAPHLDEIVLFDIGEYFAKNFNNRWAELNPLQYWTRMVEVAPYLTLDGRAKLFSVLWGGIDDLTQLFRTLAGALEQLGHAEDAVTDLAALRPRLKSIIDVAALKRLGQPDDMNDKLRLKVLRAGTLAGPFELPRAVLTSLVAELRITIDERPWPMLEHTDLLDFPGARSRYKLAELPPPTQPGHSIDENSREDLVLELLLRGKIAYLFQRYSDERELTAMLLCMGNKPNEVKDLGVLVKHWIELTHGATPEQRRKVQTSLFLVLTMIDLEFQAKAGESIDQKWNTRLHTSLVEPYKHDRWVDHWDDKPFNNTVLLRNPNFDQEWLVEYATEPGSGELVKPLKEIGLSRRNEGHRGALADSFFASDAVKRHVRDPESAWNAILTLNDGGVTRIVELLSAVSDPALKNRQVEERLREGVQSLHQNLKRFYHGVDEDTRREKEAALRELRKALQVAFRPRQFRTFPRFLAHLALNERDIREIALNVAAMRVDAVAPVVADDGDDIFAAPRPKAVKAPPQANDRARLFARELHRHWIAQLRRLSGDDDLLQYYGLKAAHVADLVDQLIIAADRLKIEDKLAERVRAATQLAAVRWDDMADRVVTLALHGFNVFVAELGFHDVALDQRPGFPEGVAQPERRVFQPPVHIARPRDENQRQLPTLGAEPEPLELRYFVDWGVAFLAAGLSNLSYGGGRDLSDQQNEALGRLLSRLSLDRQLAQPDHAA